MTWQLVLLNVIIIGAGLCASCAGALIGCRLALHRVLRLGEPTVEIGGVVMPQSHYYAATAPFRQPDGSLVVSAAPPVDRG